MARNDKGPYPTIRRCDAAGCDRVEVEFDLSGIFFVLRQRSGPWFVKIERPAAAAGLDTPQEGLFVEVATGLLTTWVYYGTCPGATFTERP